MTEKRIQLSETKYSAITGYPNQSGEYVREQKEAEMFPTNDVGSNSDDFLSISTEQKPSEVKPETSTPQKEVDSGMQKYWLDRIPSLSLKNSQTGSDFITPELKSLFSPEKTSVNMREFTDENGNIKQGYELFDLNHDNKLDDLEISYFTSGGALLKTGNKTLDVENFVEVIRRLDRFDSRYDKNTTEQNRKMLYRFMTLSNELIDELKDFPEGMQELYASRLAQLKDVQLNTKITSGGSCDGSELTMNDFKNPNYFKDVLFHELTHSVLDSADIKEEAITQEVQTHFMESRYYAYKKGKDKYPNFGWDYPKFISDQYELMERENPDITKLDIAKAVFMANRFDEYASSYRQHDKDKYIYNAQYADIGGYFKEPANKKAIYETGIQKAFANATLKDENGKELITDEIRNLFSPERPIITYHDMVDEEGKIKPGLELFDLDGDGVLYNEKALFSYVTYNDIPRLIQMLDEWGNLSAKNKFKSKGVKGTDRISTTESRKIIAENLYLTDYSQGTFNFHKSNRGQLEKLY